MKPGDRVEGNGKPPGFAAIGVFLFFGASMASLAATTLLLPGTPLDRAWILNPTAYKQLSPLGGRSAFSSCSSLSCSSCRESDGSGVVSGDGDLPSLFIATQVLGDITNLVRGDWLRGGTGFIIASALLLYLLTPRVRAAFSRMIV